jgi:hypothetical protein
MSAPAPQRPPIEPASTPGSDNLMLWIVGGAVLVLCIIGLFTYSAGQQNEQAEQLAAELTQKLEQAGFTAPDQDIIVRSLGDDGGAVCNDPGGALRVAILHDQISNGASFVGRRPVIADNRLIAGEALILDTYCPDELPQFREKFDDLKFDDTIKQ